MLQCERKVKMSPLIAWWMTTVVSVFFVSFLCDHRESAIRACPSWPAAGYPAISRRCLRGQVRSIAHTYSLLNIFCPRILHTSAQLSQFTNHCVCSLFKGCWTEISYCWQIFHLIFSRSTWGNYFRWWVKRGKVVNMYNICIECAILYLSLPYLRAQPEDPLFVYPLCIYSNFLLVSTYN